MKNTDRTIAQFKVGLDVAEVIRSARGRYSLYIGSDKPVVSRLTAEEMMRVVASYANGVPPC
jgi:hypothetical protein